MELADGDIFNVITNGRRTMPPYKYQVVTADRWAIIAYVRVLQRAAHGTVGGRSGGSEGGTCNSSETVAITMSQTHHAGRQLPTRNQPLVGRPQHAVLRRADFGGRPASRAISRIRSASSAPTLVAFAFTSAIGLGAFFFVMAHVSDRLGRQRDGAPHHGKHHGHAAGGRDPVSAADRSG